MAECLQLTAAELAAMEADGWTVVSGPHDTEAECLAECEGASGVTDPGTSCFNAIDVEVGGDRVAITCGAGAVVWFRIPVSEVSGSWVRVILLVDSGPFAYGLFAYSGECPTLTIEMSSISCIEMNVADADGDYLYFTFHADFEEGGSYELEIENGQCP